MKWVQWPFLGWVWIFCGITQNRWWKTLSITWFSQRAQNFDRNTRLSSIISLLHGKTIMYMHRWPKVEIWLSPLLHNVQNIMHQSIPPAPSPPPGWPLFFAWDGKFPGVGPLELSNPRGGDEKRGQMPRPPSTLQHFPWSHSRKCHFTHVNVQFFVPINVFLVIELGS